jgi:hypothetical protein
VDGGAPRVVGLNGCSRMCAAGDVVIVRNGGSSGAALFALSVCTDVPSYAQPGHRDPARTSRLMSPSIANTALRTASRGATRPRMSTAPAIHLAADVLVEAGWLVPPKPGAFQQRGRAAYKINHRIYELAM